MDGKKVDNQKKVLIVTTVSGFVPQFEMNNVRILQDMEYEVHYAANYNTVSYGNDNSRLDGTGIVRHQVDFERSPFQVGANHKAFKQLKKILMEDVFSLVHCHTPVGAAIARLVIKDLVKRESIDIPQVIYTAHGFHFYKGAPLKYWLMFYPVERYLARYTDVIITINMEDYERAKRFCRNKKTRVEYMPGVGIDTEFFSGKNLQPGEREQIRKEMRKQLGIRDNEEMLLSVGELIPRKNHIEVIEALRDKKNISTRKGYLRAPKEAFGYDENRIQKYFICGQGVLKDELQLKIDRYGLSDRVTLLGYRNDVRNLLYAADVFVFPSKQEGMPVALLEAMAAGVPVIVKDIRGSREILLTERSFEDFDRKHINACMKDTYKSYCLGNRNEENGSGASFQL